MTGQESGRQPTGQLWADGEAADTPLADGDWRLALRRAELADIDFAGRRVLRSIRFIVRDHDWRTADTVVTSTGHLEGNQRWLRGVCGFDDRPVLEWQAKLGLGTRLTLSVRARAVQEFERNRAGLIVLHGPEFAGQPLEVVHTDGTTEATVFPTEIAPHQPARDVGGYRWRADGVECELRFAGEVFEMEDQRNWTDASYKTYSTPLDLPFPIPVRPGSVIEQSLELACRRLPEPAVEVDHRAAPRLIMPTAERLPILQLGAGTAPGDPRTASAEDDQPTGRQPILVEVPADESCWPDVLGRARHDAAGQPVDVRIVAELPGQIAPVIRALSGTAVARIAVYERESGSTGSLLLDALQAAIHDQQLDAEVLAGTRAHFTELNRTIGDYADFGGPLTFSITPQMHDRSRAQVIESLPVQRLVAEQAVRLAGSRGVHIGPVTLRPRFNAVATSPFAPDDHGPIDVDGYGPQQVPESTDPRQTAPAAAAWTICSIAALAVPGVRSICFFEAWGPRGIRSAPRSAGRSATVYPVGVVWDWVTGAGPLVEAPPIDPLSTGGRDPMVGVISQQQGQQRQLLIGNPGDRPAVLRLHVGAITVAGVIGNDPEVRTSDGVQISIPPAGTVRLLV